MHSTEPRALEILKKQKQIKHTIRQNKHEANTLLSNFETYYLWMYVTKTKKKKNPMTRYTIETITVEQNWEYSEVEVSESRGKIGK